MKKKINITISIIIVILGLLATLKLYLEKKESFKNDVQLTTDYEGAKVDSSEIVEGCVGGKDCIPSIDNPKFENIETANKWLADEDIVFGVNYEGIQKAYPQRILNWHEIVNDVFGDQPVLVTFCPLCNTGVSFIPKVNGETIEFGVSGKLRNSDLIMYDRLEGNLWQQATGEAIVGPAARRNEELEWVSTTTTTWGKWKAKYPNTVALSKNTGFNRDYSQYPYGDYETNNQNFIFPTNYKEMEEISAKEIVYGIDLGDTQIAYPEKYMEEGSMLDNVGKRNIEITKNEACEVTFKDIDTNETLEYLRSFWFAWSSFYPQSKVYSPTDL